MAVLVVISCDLLKNCRYFKKMYTFLPQYTENNYLRSLPRDLATGGYFDWRPGRHTGSLGRCNRYLARKKIGKWNPDIVHETYYADTAVTPNGVSTVLTVYDMIDEMVPDQTAETNITEVKKKSVERADHIICISEGTRRELIERFDVDEDKTSVVYFGIDIDEKEDYRPPEKNYSRPFLLYVGASREGYKNFATVLHAVAASSRLKKRLRHICVWRARIFRSGTNVD